jgi:hypothetical protein
MCDDQHHFEDLRKQQQQQLVEKQQQQQQSPPVASPGSSSSSSSQPRRAVHACDAISWLQQQQVSAHCWFAKSVTAWPACIELSPARTERFWQCVNAHACSLLATIAWSSILTESSVKSSMVCDA